ncbi:cbb3-type cytochrome c oxidase subunit 3 [Hoeflea sp.]|uniref:cbb3-type cytochrome c oxidase subunit 3 n=1 Tax=Hoeflea sp. TaxID=1940281 RepID=UPI003B02821B
MDYQTMRTFADSWGLLFLVIVFVVVVIYTFRPGSKKQADEIARIPLKDDDDPNKDDKE